ncbi:hypothetical protein D910_02266 [Dendroctonus ponderosae]|uniref:ABC transmembrane type-1 domain-containing protein n=1 Tax=Dendroctonus ponderosae TaxID=77166 RepID=U4TVP8_DENPD|nr:hypothetical protein D910_02266 [Dendroctonus ponderosae]
MDAAFKLKKDNPKKKANFLSKLFFAWTVPLFQIGNKRKIQLTDLYKTLPADKSEFLGDKLEYYWREQVDKAAQKPNGKPSLLMAMTKAFFWEYAIYGLVFFIQYVVLRSPQPMVLAILVKQFEPSNVTIDKAAIYISASLVVLISLLMIFFMHHGNFGVSAIGMRIRIAVSSLIYRKIMKLNRRSQGQTAAGQVINILSNDVQRFDQVTVFLHFLWLMPIQVIFVSYLMWTSIGIYCLVGIGAMIIITIPLQSKQQTITGLCQTESVNEVKTETIVRPGRLTENVAAVRVNVEEIPITSIWHKAQEIGVSTTNIHRIFTKDLKLHAYTVELAQELKPEDHAQRRAFVDWILGQRQLGGDFSTKIIFSDEAHFHLDGFVNEQNCCIWGPKIHERSFRNICIQKLSLFGVHCGLEASPDHFSSKMQLVKH